MPTTLRNTDILFNDGTTQSTAAGVPSAFNSVGSIVIAVNQSTSNLFPGNTIAGSSLLYVTGYSSVTNPPTAYSAGFVEGAGPGSPTTNSARADNLLNQIWGVRAGNVGAYTPANTTTLPGTWRVLCAVRSRWVQYVSYTNETTYYYAGCLVQRIS